MIKTYPLRLDQTIAEELEFVATIDGVTITEELRQAVRAHLDRRREDGDFQERLRASRDRDQEMYERLSAEVRAH